MILHVVGVVDAFDNEESKPEDQRYIIKPLIEPDVNGDKRRVKVVCTLVLAAAFLIVDGCALTGDTTFSCIIGEFDRWDLVLFEDHTQRRTYLKYLVTQFLDALLGFTGARIYHNCKTRQAYRMVFQALHSAVKEVTGKDIHFQGLHGCGLHGITTDCDVAQTEGFGDYLLETGPFLRSIPRDHYTNPLTIVQYAQHLCWTHYDR
jgi:hypothetical protein